jgi:Zn-dependent peptidase ImmA (M78 family)
MQQRTTPSSSATSHRLPRGRAYDPWAHADLVGLQVIVRPIRTANEMWLPDHNTIVIRSGLRSAHQRVALAHGIGHADLAHRDDRPKHEHQADRYASLYLIDPLELEDFWGWSDDAGRVAQELGVTRRVLDAYLSFRPAS